MANDEESPSERWRRVERVYLSALARTDVERAALLDDLCRGDETLRRDVELLLRVQPAAQSFLDTGAMAVAAEMMRGEVGTDLIGQTLDGYTITGRLGAGGMGEVYRAHDSRLGRDVAIKVLPTALADDPDRLSRFDREARALAALNHPNIATIHGIAQTVGAAGSAQASAVRAIVLELVEGPTLSERLARGPVPLDEALAIARQIAEALDAAPDHSPRPQAVEYQDQARRRGQGPRFWSRQARESRWHVRLQWNGAARRCSHSVWPGDRHHRVHVAGASARRAGRQAHGHLGVWLRLVRNVGRPPCVRWRDDV